MNGATQGGNDGLGLEYIEFLFTGAESDSTNTLITIHDRINNKDPFIDFATCISNGVFSGLCNDDLIGLTIDHKLPAAFMNILAFFVCPDLEAPFFKKMYRGIYVTGNVVDQVFSGNPHQVLANVTDIVFYRIIAVSDAHVLVDGRKPHGHRTTSVHSSLVNHSNLKTILFGPVSGLCGCTTC